MYEEYLHKKHTILTMKLTVKLHHLQIVKNTIRTSKRYGDIIVVKESKYLHKCHILILIGIMPRRK